MRTIAFTKRKKRFVSAVIVATILMNTMLATVSASNSIPSANQGLYKLGVSSDFHFQIINSSSFNARLANYSSSYGKDIKVLYNYINSGTLYWGTVSSAPITNVNMQLIAQFRQYISYSTSGVATVISDLCYIDVYYDNKNKPKQIKYRSSTGSILTYSKV